MKKFFMLEDLDCAVCAGKIEDAVRKIKGVNSVSVNFMTQKLTLDAPDAEFDDILKIVAKTVKKIEPDCRLIIKEG